MKHSYTIAILAMLGGLSLQAAAQGVKVDSLDFDKAMSTSPATMLRGKVSGVRVTSLDGSVNGAVNTYIRGVNSLRQDSQPLWIVDGVMLNASLTDNNDAFFQYGEDSYTSPLNALAFINPYDIESIEVIKDLSAATIYGAKGANGVIIINTKLPKTGKFNIDWNSNVGFLSTNSLRGRKAFELIAEGQGLSHNHSISLNGAVGQTKYNVSGYYRKVMGAVEGNTSSFGGIRARFDTRANKVVWFGMDATFTIGDMANPAGTAYYGEPSLTLLMRNDGSFPADTKAGWLSDYNDDAHDRRGTASAYVTLNFTPAFSWKTTFGIDFQNNNRYIWYGNGTSFGKRENGAASVLGTSVFKYDGKSVLNWNRYFGKKHRVTLEGGIEASGDMTKYNTLNGTDFFTHELRAKGLSLAASKSTLRKYDRDYSTWGFFADAGYDFDGIAGISLVARADNTPRYDDKNFNIYKGGSAYFDIHRAFFRAFTPVSTVKIKGGYGEAGREKYVPYGMYDIAVSGAWNKVDTEYQPFYEGFARLTSKEINAGIELGFLKDRIMLSAGWYDKTSVDNFNSYCFGELQLGKTLWTYCDRKDHFKRSCTIANRGIEADLTVKIFEGKDFNWSVSANGAYNVNQMLDIDALELFGSSVGSGTSVNAYALGLPVGSIFGYKVGADGQFVDVNGNGRIDEYDQTIIGNPIPKFTGGLNTCLRYKNFSAEIFADAAMGFDILNMNDLLFSENPDDIYISDRFLEKGDYFRISRISIGYDFVFKAKCFIKSLKITASALNPVTITGYSGWSPDVNSFANSALTAGVDYGSYPAMCGCVLGAALKF